MLELLVGLDVETANRSRSSICMLGLVTSRGEQLVTLVRPDPPEFIDDFVEMHGIDADAVRDAPTFATAIGPALPHLASAIVVAHNAEFHVGALHAAALESSSPVSIPAISAVCTVDVAQRVWPHFHDHKLATLARLLGIPHDGHDSGSDAAAALAVLFKAMLEKRVGTLGDLVATGHARVQRFPPVGALPAVVPLSAPVHPSRGPPATFAAVPAKVVAAAPPDSATLSVRSALAWFFAMLLWTMSAVVGLVSLGVFATKGHRSHDDVVARVVVAMILVVVSVGFGLFGRWVFGLRRARR